MINMIISTFIFFLGIAIGSFLNVVLDRLYLSPEKYQGKKIKDSRSICPSCQKELVWYEIIPLLSYLIQGGKCRKCQAKIPFRLFLVEFLTGFLFLAYVFTFFNLENLTFLQLLFHSYHLVMISLLILIFFIDLYKYIIPNKIIVPMIFSALIIEPFWALNNLKHSPLNLDKFFFDVYWTFKIFFQNLFPQKEIFSYPRFGILPAWGNPLLAAIIITSFFFGVVLLTKGRGMGMGDVRFSFFLGLFLGWEKTLLAFYLAFIIGAIVSLVLIIKKRKKTKDRVPFGPFLIMGIFFSLFFSESLLAIMSRLSKMIAVF